MDDHTRAATADSAHAHEGAHVDNTPAAAPVTTTQHQEDNAAPAFALFDDDRGATQEMVSE